MTQIPAWVDYLAPFLSGAVGIGMAYGILRNSMENLKERVIRMEAVIDHQVGETRCREYRDSCRSNVHDRLEDISKKLNKIDGDMVGISIKVAKIDKSTE